jgi:hypothetical protein
VHVHLKQPFARELKSKAKAKIESDARKDTTAAFTR